MSKYMKYQCPECDGEKQVPCECGCPNCDAEVPCEWCSGTGYNPSIVDVDAFNAACKERFGKQMSCDYRKDQKGPNTALTIGRKSYDGTIVVLVDDFTHKALEKTRRAEQEQRNRQHNEKFRRQQPEAVQPQSSPGQRSMFDALDAAAPPRSV
jgi:hypothetical protein